MADRAEFEANIAGLMDYYNLLDSVDPKSINHSNAINPEIFFTADTEISRSLNDAKSATLGDIGSRARIAYDEYDNGVARGISTRDLREDDAEQRAERARILAAVSSPRNPEAWTERTTRIKALLERIVAGETIHLPGFKGHPRTDEQNVTIDNTRPLYGVFVNGHVSDRVLTVQYDTATFFDPHNKLNRGERALAVNLPGFVKLEMVA